METSTGPCVYLSVPWQGASGSLSSYALSKMLSDLTCLFCCDSRQFFVVLFGLSLVVIFKMSHCII